MSAIVLIHWPGLHHAQVDSAILEYACGTWDLKMIAVANGPCEVFECYPNIPTVLDFFPSHVPIFMVPESDVPKGETVWGIDELAVHPIDALYVVGADGGFGYEIPDEYPDNSLFVTIDTPNGPNRSLWSHQVVTVIGYDRFLNRVGD